MIINPLPWKINDNGEIVEFGGNLTNSEYRFRTLRNVSHENYSVKTMNYCNDNIFTVNWMNNIQYRINNKVLSVILEKEYFINGNKLINFNSHPETELLNKYRESNNFIKINDITKHNSKYYEDTSIINIARLYSDVDKFYLNNFIDWRGRIYASNCILNIQGSDLARSLLMFAEGKELNNIGLYALKTYTANAFGLNKKSKNDRVKWVNENYNDIINTPENDLWLKSNEPLVFLSCALELKEYEKARKSGNIFISRLIILLDATCNGLQHLSAIANDITLGEKVNISSSTNDTTPNDVYSDMIEPIKESIKELVRKNPQHYNLLKLNINRKLIKRGIMTITYGVTEYGIKEQLLNEHFIKIDHDIANKTYIYVPKDNSDSPFRLSGKDIYQLAKIIHNELFKKHSSLENIMKYFQSIVKLLNHLELSINWITPYGLKISQMYNKFTTYDITSMIQGKRRKISLRKVDFDDNLQPRINEYKQVNSFIPNFIHSMDASNIVLLIKKVNKDYNFNIVTIHDCFGVQANHTELLSFLVKESFISIYGDNKCIEKFHDHVLKNIYAVYESQDNGMIIDKNNNVIKIPPKPNLGNMNLKEQLLNSNYFIN